MRSGGESGDEGERVDRDGPRVPRGPLRVSRNPLRGRRLLWSLGALAGLVLVGGALALAVLRGRLAVPAGRLERTLSELVDGTVRIGGLRIAEGPRRAVVTGVVITDLATMPQVRRIELDRVTLFGTARDLLGGDFERAVVEGASAELEPRCGPPPALPAGAADRASGRRYEVRIEPASLTLLGPGPRRALDLEGTLRNDGSGLTGDLLLRAGEMELRRVASLWRAGWLLACPDDDAAIGGGAGLDGTLRDARVELRFAPAPAPDRWRADVVAAARTLRLVGVPGGSGAELASPSASGEVVLGATARVVAEVVLPDVEPIVVSTVSAAGRLVAARASAHGIDLASWARELRPAVAAELDGAADIELAYEAGRADAALSIRLRRVAAGSGRELRGVDAAIEASEVDLAAGTAKVRGTVGVESVTAERAEPSSGEGGDLLAAVLGAGLPLQARFDGDLSGLTPSGDEPRAVRVGGTITTDSTALGRLALTGTAQLGEVATGRYQWSHPDGGALWTTLRAALPASRDGSSPADLELDRELASWRVDGSLRGGGTWAVDLDGVVRDDVVLDDVVGSLRSSGSVRFDGALARAADAEEAAPWRWEVGELAVDYELAGGAVRLAARGDGPLALSPLAPVPAAVEARAVLGAGTLRLEQVEVRAEGIGTLELDGGVGRARSEGGVRLRGVELPAWRVWLEPLFESAALPARELRGRVDADGRWRRDREQWLVDGEMLVLGGGWAAADGSREVAGLAPRLQVSGRRGPSGSSVAVAGDLGGFQLLWGSVFADFADRSVAVEVAVDSDGAPASAAPTDGAPLRATARLSGDGGAGATLSAARDGGGTWVWQVQGAVADLATAVERYVTSPFALEGTAWEGLAAAGRLDLEAAGRLDDGGGTVQAEVLLVDGAATLGDRQKIAGVFAQLPVELAWRLSPDGGRPSFEARGAPRRGRVAFQSLRLGDVEIGPTAAPLEVAGDGVTLEAPFVVPIFDGELEVTGLRLADALAAEPYLEGSVTVRGLSLQRASSDLGLPELQGTIDGAFPRVVLRGDRLTAEGTSEVSVFGGRVVLEGVSASDLGSPFPHLSFAATFEDLDLEQLTQTLEFGRITGRLRGELREVELAGTTPVRLLGELRTAERSGVPQRLSIRAVNNLTLLGTGADASFLERGLRSLFESYPYEAIGIAVLLEGDDFVLRGLERRGDKELFLKGRWPLRLDIVNAVPGTRVSYETMTSRIGNLQIRRGKDDDAPQGRLP